ncbi:hypothetical protein C0993_006777 [Termitomyces sp. T159_Od127]|nr:hypothetical protein C0993_006777 [Termitomyces sp. T159_Od127]
MAATNAMGPKTHTPAVGTRMRKTPASVPVLPAQDVNKENENGKEEGVKVRISRKGRGRKAEDGEPEIEGVIEVMNGKTGSVGFSASYIDWDLLDDDPVLSVEKRQQKCNVRRFSRASSIISHTLHHPTNLIMPPRKGSGAASTEPTRRSSRIVAQPKEEQPRAASKKRSAKAAEREDAGPEDGSTFPKKVIFISIRDEEKGSD